MTAFFGGGGGNGGVAGGTKGLLGWRVCPGEKAGGGVGGSGGGALGLLKVGDGGTFGTGGGGKGIVGMFTPCCPFALQKPAAVANNVPISSEHLV